MEKKLHIIGAGMAGSEAAWHAANRGLKVVIHEMRPKVKTFAHQTENFAEMVCSNSFRSNDHNTNAVGLLHWEMQNAGGIIINAAKKHRLPAGGALAVDRALLSDDVTTKLKNHPNISVSNDDWLKVGNYVKMKCAIKKGLGEMELHKGELNDNEDYEHFPEVTVIIR